MVQLPDALKLLGLYHTATHLDDLVAVATKRRWSSKNPSPSSASASKTCRIPAKRS